MTRRHPSVLRDRDRGSAVVLVVAGVAVLLSVTVGGLLVVSAVLASHRAQSAADLAVLAAAVSLAAGEDTAMACARGAEVAARNGATLVRCRESGALSMEIAVSVRASVARLGAAVARSRAGPQQQSG